MSSSNDQQAAPSRQDPNGACIWLTGRSGAGKTTVTDALLPELERAGRTVTVLDIVPLLAKGPGEKTSEPKLLRKAFVASEVVRHGGIVICVTVSARRSVRDKAREIIGTDHFIEVYFDVPLEVSQARRKSRGSRKSTKKALKDLARPLARLFSDKHKGDYEPPTTAEVTLDAVRQSPGESAQQIMAALEERGVLESQV